VTFAAIELNNPAMFDQKVEYNHNDPVKEGCVTLPEHYVYSSAHPESPLKMFGNCWGKEAGSGQRPMMVGHSAHPSAGWGFVI
jgi:hypothetical protein